MIEVEIKLPLSGRMSPEELEKSLKDQGFLYLSHIQETDTYFDNEAGEIRSSNQALRIRMETDLSTGKTVGMVTFKGKLVDKTTATREEYETEVADPMTMHRILHSLGYRDAQPVVTKERTMLTRSVHFGSELSKDSVVSACLDKVEGLGDFLELEVLVETEDQKPLALQCIEDVLSSIGFSLEDTVRTSYLSQLQKKMEGR